MPPQRRNPSTSAPTRRSLTCAFPAHTIPCRHDLLLHVSNPRNSWGHHMIKQPGRGGRASRQVIRILLITASVIPTALIAGCGTPGPVLGGIAAGAVIAGQAPTNELQQVYYIGMFDPL